VRGTRTEPSGPERGCPDKTMINYLKGRPATPLSVTGVLVSYTFTLQLRFTPYTHVPSWAGRTFCMCTHGGFR
jgi:hypothetical protein